MPSEIVNIGLIHDWPQKVLLYAKTELFSDY